MKNGYFNKSEGAAKQVLCKSVWTAHRASFKWKEQVRDKVSLSCVWVNFLLDSSIRVTLMHTLSLKHVSAQLTRCLFFKLLLPWPILLTSLGMGSLCRQHFIFWAVQNLHSNTFRIMQWSALNITDIVLRNCYEGLFAPLIPWRQHELTFVHFWVFLGQTSFFYVQGSS